MKQFLFLLFFLPLVASAATQDGVINSPGDIAFLAYNGQTSTSVRDDGIAFILLDDCPDGTAIIFTDTSWNGTEFPSLTAEGDITWTNNTGSIIARGSVIKIINAGDQPAVPASGILAYPISVNIGSAQETEDGFSTLSGDQIYAFTGSGRSSPGTFLAFYGSEESLGASAKIAGTSLVSGQTAQLNISEGYYIGPETCNSTLSACLSQIYNTSNWSFTDNPSYPSNLPDTFTGSLFSTNNAPTAASFTASPVYQGTAYAFSTSDFSYSDTDGDPLNHIRIVTVPAQGSLWLDSDGSNTINGGESALSNGSLVSKASIDAGYLKYLNTTGSSSSFTFDVNDGTAYSAGSYTTTLTVTAYPSITLSASSTSPAESAGSVNLTATASHAFNQDITVNLSYSGTATSGVDYTQISSLVITTGNTTKTSALSISEDATEEVNETIIVDISTISNGTESGTQQQTITIVDNDQTIPSVAISGASGTINVAFTATFTFSEDVTGFTVGDIVAGNASVSAFSATSASVYTALITPTADGAVTVDVAGSVAQDGVGNSNTAATQLAVTYDGTAPTVAISGASGSINAPFTATFTFSENVTGFTVGDIVAGNASVSAFSATSASVYTALITPTADGSVTVDVAGSVAQDGVGNRNTAATQLAVTYDATAPTVAISGASGNINAAFTATFTFSEAMSGIVNNNYISVSNASVSAFNAISSSVYTALITPTADGVVTVDVTAGVVQDTAGNNNTAAVQLAVTYDGTQPSVVISGASGSINAAFTATFTFSENVTGFTVGDIVAGNASVSAFSATSASVYTALITPTADGSVTVDVAGSVAQDGVGNNNTAATQLAVTYDATAPTVAISGASGNINAAFTATFTFSENVTGFTVGDIVAGNASVSAFSATSASVYTALITPTADGAVTVDVAGSVAQDGVGNSNTAATQLAVTYDGTAPTVAISGASGSINAPFTATFTFSENVTGFTVGDIVAGNASVSAFSATSASVYTALITPTADGSVTVDVAGSVAQDGVGNRNTAATQLAVTYDATAPTVAISGASGNINAAFTATFTFSEAMSGIVNNNYISVSNASVSAFNAISSSVYTALITPTADGVVTVDVTAGVVQDTAGNNNTAAVQLAVTYDGTQPSVVISGASGSINAAFTATFTFSEAMMGITDNSYISVTNASVGAFNAISSSVYTALITPTAEGAVTVDVAAGVVQDTAGNSNTAATQLAITYDTTAPAVVISSAKSSFNAPFTATFTFSEAMSSITDNSYISVTNASVGAFNAISSSVYTALITPTAEGAVTVDVAAGVVQDTAGNSNTAATQLAITYDTTAPTVVISSAKSSFNAPFTATFTFSEAMSGITDNSYISVTNASVGAFNAISSSVYTALITPTAEGAVTVDVAAGVVQDTAGNSNTAATQLAITYDTTAPTVVISSAKSSFNAPFTATFTFSEAMSSITDNSYISVTNASVGAFNAISSSVYTALITPTAEGAVTVNVAAAAAQDAAGNNNTAATQLAVTYDATAPTVVISGASGVVNGPFTATFTFSEVVGDFVAADVTLTNATPGAFVTVSQTEYRLEVTPAALGQVTVTVAANSAHDAATNGNPQSTLSVNYQDSVPTLSLQGPALATGSFTLTLEFSETVTGLEETDITVANGSVQQLTGSGALYSAEILPATLGSVVSISVAAGAVKDLSGQDNQAAMLMVFTNNNGSVGISGLAVEGQVLSAQVNDADGIDDATQVYQWLSDGNPVGSAATYTIVAGDVGHSISLQVSYTDDLGRDEQWTSAATGTVISIQQYALDTISAAAGSDVNAALLTVVQYRQAGLDWPDNVGFTRILPILNSAVARSQADDVNELSELEALVALIMEAQDDDGDGLPNSLEGTATTDRDGDGIVDRKDTDSDQDGLSDRVELGLVLTDTDSDGIIDFFDADIDNDGNVDDGRTDDNLDGAEDSLMTVEGYRAANALADADSDGLLNSQDLDSDNDSIGDIVENRLADADGNLLVDDARVEIDDSNDLIDDNNDGIFNFLQLSSDGIQTDFSRTGLPKLLDADNDGRLDSTVDMDRDGLIDAVDNAVGAFGSLPDIDGDGIPNHLDDDDDGDGIPDADENPQLGFFTGLDADADGIDDGVDYDVNGLISGTDTNANGVRDDREMPDHDNDGIADHLDPDSDNDNVTDGEDPSINTGDDVTTATGAFSPLMLLIAAALAMAGRMAARMSVPTLLLVGMLWAPLSQANSTQPASELAVDDMHWLLAWGVGYSWLSPEVHGNNKVTDDGGLAGHFAAGLQLNDAWQVRYQYNIPGSAEVNSAAIEYTVHSLLAQYSQPLQGQWRWMLGAGASQIDVDVAAGFNADLDSEIQLSLQAGASYQLPNNISIALQATRYSGDVQTLMLDFSHLIP